MKYWIEEATTEGNFKGPHSNPHGNPWYVFTTVYDFDNEEEPELVISIPYHAEKTAYLNGDINEGYEDFYEHPQAWNDWLSLTQEQRREYIREFRRTKNNKMIKYETIDAKVMASRFLEAFVTFPAAQTACDAMQPNKENTMNDTATYALERDLNKAYQLATEKLAEKHHIHPHHAGSLREYLSMIEAKQYEPFTDKELDRPVPAYGHAASSIVLRKQPADHATHESDTAKLDEAYRAAALAVKTTTDHDKTRKETTEAFRKTWLH